MKISWAQPHSFSAEEHEIYQILMTALSMHLGGLCARLRLSSEVRDLDLVRFITGQLSIASTFDEALRLLLLPAPANDEAEVVLCSIENDVNG